MNSHVFRDPPTPPDATFPPAETAGLSWDYHGIVTLPETNSSHLPGCAITKENWSSNHPFSGAMLVLGIINHHDPEKDNLIKAGYFWERKRGIGAKLSP